MPKNCSKISPQTGKRKALKIQDKCSISNLHVALLYKSSAQQLKQVRIFNTGLLERQESLKVQIFKQDHLFFDVVHAYFLCSISNLHVVLLYKSNAQQLEKLRKSIIGLLEMYESLKVQIFKQDHLFFGLIHTYFLCSSMYYCATILWLLFLCVTL